MWKVWVRLDSQPGIWASPFKSDKFLSALDWIRTHQLKHAKSQNKQFSWVILSEGEAPMGPTQIEVGETPNGSWEQW